MKPIFRDILTLPNESFTLNEFHLDYFDIPWHLHPQYELIYIIQSSGKRYVGDSIEDFSPGDLVLVGKELPHCWLNAPIGECKGLKFDVHYKVIQFNPDFLGPDYLTKPEFYDLAGLLVEAKRGIHFTGDTSKTVKNDFINIQQSTGLDRIINFLILIQKLIFWHNKRYLSSNTFLNQVNYKEHPAMKKVNKYIYENFKSGIRLEDAAKKVGLTPTSFCRFFRQIQKKSFLAFVKEFRIEYASRLVRDTTISINEIAFESGYENLSNFYRQFLEIKGLTPVQYRKNHQDYRKSE